ncbi:hypothetical protein P2R12_08095 [Cytobacillus oceanisediminis]|uniref:hypothetical protein n=1 Tax=Cytobacillus oceanisediminis TaxID=665099 RepID=UPI0023DB3E42|nr:hypothetical protein [Cytobacillus oceanisediminis]MDF2036934.1 hypothetical protein [Cytobacillus oceanisediminis]
MFYIALQSNGESRSINSYLSAMSVFDMGVDAPDYRSVNEELEKESVNIERLLESIKEPMLVIDDYYADALKNVDSN